MAGLLAAVALAYAQVGGFDFVDYDDTAYVYQNPHVTRGLTLKGIAWALTSFHAANWHPLTWISHMADVSLFGLWPGGHHLTSLVVHALVMGLLLKTLWELTGRFWPSAWVAGLFALHPLHVESVAWVSERKDLLCALFWVLGLQAYGRWATGGKRCWYLALTLFFLLALASKPMAISFPCVLLLLDFWPLKRWPSRSPLALLLEKIPLFVMAAISGAVTLLAQHSQGAMGSMDVYPFGQRLINALSAYLFYLGKTLWPCDLAFFYPYPEPAPLPAAIAALALMTAVTAVAWQWRGRYPFVLIGWLWFVGTLVPVIGIVQVGMQARADRYTYLPLIGIFMASAWGLAVLARRSKRVKTAVVALAALVLVAAAWGANRQARYWRDSMSLAQRAMAVTRDNYPAHIMAAGAFKSQGRLDEAQALLARAIALHPQETTAVMLFGDLMAEQDQVDKAMGFYHLAIELNPALAQPHYRLGKIHQARSDRDKAEWHFRQALGLNPAMAAAHNDLGLIQAARGRLEAAIFHFEQALAIDGDFGEARHNLALARGLFNSPEGRQKEPAKKVIPGG